MIIGITGRPCTGKTSFGKFLTQEGGIFIDCDQLVHRLYEKGQKGCKKVEHQFGKEFLTADHTVDRVKLRNVVFNDTEALHRLNTLIHPLVAEKVAELISTHYHEPLVVIEATYLKTIQPYLDKIIEVISTEKSALRRAEEKGISEDMYKRICTVQPLPEFVDAVIMNNSSLVDLQLKARRILKQFLQ